MTENNTNGSNGGEGRIRIEDDDARAGRVTGRMRWVLGISLLIAIVALSIAWIIPALQEGDVESAELATERVEEMREEGTAPQDIPAVPADQPDAPESTGGQ